jgi:polysaccharide pyruvyl transferase WcaK-like protein
VYVDHGEAYGNLGEEAMILNALARIENYLLPRKIYITHPADEPLPTGGNSRVQDTPSPFRAFRAAAEKWQRRLRRLRKVPVLRRWIHAEGDVAYWRFLAWIDRRLPILSGLRGNDEVRQFLRALEDSRVYYHVGMSGLNEFWEHGLVFKHWVLQQARTRVELVVLSSQGLGPVSTASTRNEMRELLELADIISLRDKSHSMELLAELGISRAAAKIVFDEAFSLVPAPEETAREWLARAGLSPADAFVAVHYREVDYTSGTIDPVVRIGDILQLARKETDLKFLFVPMSYAAHSRIDHELGRRIAACLGNPDWYCLLSECRDVRIIKAIIGHARFSMGLSYHTHVFSLSQGHPALVLYTGGYYGLKSEGLVGFYGPPSRALDLDKVSAGQIAEAVREIVANHDGACRHIAAVNDALRRDNDWTLEEVRRRLGAKSAS